MQSYKAEGTTKPEKIDDISSKNYVYLRKDVYDVITEQEDLKNRIAALEKAQKSKEER